MENKRTKLIYTAVVYYLFLQLALRFGIFGPSLADLQANLGVSSNAMSHSFAFNCLGICLGAISSGFITRVVAIELAASILMFLTSCLVFTFASVSNFSLFVVWNFAVGFTSGAGISICEAWVLDIWKSECGAYMQALQFFRGLGYILGPLLVGPFLSEEVVDELDDSGNITTSWNATISPLANGTETSIEYNYNIAIPFMINSAMILVGSLLALALFIYRRTHRDCREEPAKTISTINITSDSVLSLESTKPELIVQLKDASLAIVIESRVKYFGYTIVLLASVFYLFFYEEVIVTYLPLFATKVQVHLSKSQASLLTSVFNLANVCGKAVSIVLALKMNHLSMLYMNLSIMAASLVGLIIFANQSRLALWIGICVHGVGLSNIVASLYTLLEETISMNALICGILNMSGTSGSVITPLIIGPYIDELPAILLYSSLVSTLGCLTMLTIIYVLLRLKNHLVTKPLSVQENTLNSKHKQINDQQLSFL